MISLVSKQVMGRDETGRDETGRDGTGRERFPFGENDSVGRNFGRLTGRDGKFHFVLSLPVASFREYVCNALETSTTIPHFFKNHQC